MLKWNNYSAFKMAEIKFSPEAIADFQQTKEYISEELGSIDAVNNTIQKIMKSIKMLETFPLSGASLTSIVDFKTDYRFLVCGNYTAFYRVENDVVYIIRVLYDKRNFMRILFETQIDEN